MRLKFFLLIMMASLFACNSDSDGVFPDPEGGEEPAYIPREDIALNTIEKQLAKKSNTFAFNLLKTVYANEKEHANILLSPLSATLAFSMLNNGAAGTTQNEIQQTLGYVDASRGDINTFAQKMVNAMQSLDPRGKFESANSIWIQNGFPVFNDFKQINQKFYEAEIQNVDFSKPATLTTINKWCSDKTHGKIPEILEEINSLTCLMLINALYFKGYWTTPFSKDLTTDKLFRASNGVEQKVPTMMKKEIKAGYTKFENCSALELPFGNGAFSLVVVLPDEETTLSTVIEQMDEAWWNKVVDFNGFAYEAFLQGHTYLVNLEIPRFKIDYVRTLNTDLMSMGMKTPFDSKAADFSLISNLPLWVGLVKQKTFAQMDEEGMEAAAVTVIGMMGASGPSKLEVVQVDFKVNRPFLYFIKEQSTGLVFFAGVMNEIKNDIK